MLLSSSRILRLNCETFEMWGLGKVTSEERQTFYSLVLSFVPGCGV